MKSDLIKERSFPSLKRRIYIIKHLPIPLFPDVPWSYYEIFHEERKHGGLFNMMDLGYNIIISRPIYVQELPALFSKLASKE